MNERRPDNRMSKVESGSTRRETTTVDGFNYDVIYLEKYLADHPESVKSEELLLVDPRIAGSVSEGNTYWATKTGKKLGPSHFIKLWKETTTANPDKTVDQFLEELKTTHPGWIEHIESIQFAKKNLSRPIWLIANAEIQQYPFDGMHRLTRAYLEKLTSIPVIVWEKLPDEALTSKELDWGKPMGKEVW